MAKLEFDTNRTTIEFVIEIKILMLEQNIKAESFAEENFQDLFLKQQLLEQRYVSALESIGLSPAGEDDMGEVEEMERVAAARRDAEDEAAGVADASVSGGGGGGGSGGDNRASMEFVERSLGQSDSSVRSMGRQSVHEEAGTRVSFAAVFGTVASFFVLGVFGEKARSSIAAGDFSAAI